MQEILQQMMARNGEICRDITVKFPGGANPSRGYYIALSKHGVWYLHYDGIIRNGVNADSGHAFWKTIKEAQKFFEWWRNTESLTDTY